MSSRNTSMAQFVRESTHLLLPQIYMDIFWEQCSFPLDLFLFILEAPKYTKYLIKMKQPVSPRILTEFYGSLAVATAAWDEPRSHKGPLHYLAAFFLNNKIQAGSWSDKASRNIILPPHGHLILKTRILVSGTIYSSLNSMQHRAVVCINAQTFFRR